VSNAKPTEQAGGRVSPYTRETFLRIIERHAKGELMMRILREDGQPCWWTFYRNVIDDDPHDGAPEDLRAAYLRAHKAYALIRTHDADEIADTQQLGEEVTVSEGPKGTTTSRKRSDVLGHRALQVKTRHWLSERVINSMAAKTALQNPDGSPINAVPVIHMTVLPPSKEG
jgi:hypothetical protein